MEQIGASAIAETKPSYPFLASNEKVLMEMRGIVGIAVANPVVRLFYAIGEICALILGFRNHGQPNTSFLRLVWL